MRTALVAGAIALGACHSFDPIREVPHRHREAATTSEAIAMILAENPEPSVYAIGEYHQTRNAVPSTSPLARFTREIIGLLEPFADHLVVEAWLDASCWGTTQAQAERVVARDAALARFTREIIGLLEPFADHLVVEAWLDASCWGTTQAQVVAATQRTQVTQMEVLRLIDRSKRLHLKTHTLPMTCIEYDAVVDASGHVDFLLLLELVTDKLADTTRSLLADGRAVIVYGGALHNDLYPRWPLDSLSYAKPLAEQLGGRVLEIDLVVPEIVAGMSMIRMEPWFPLLGRASPKRVLIWQRAPASYVVILPAQSEDVAKVAKLVDPM